MQANNVSSIILNRRKEKNLSLRELGNLTGLSSTLINKIERGSQKLTSNTIKALAPVLGLSEAELYIAANLEPAEEDILLFTDEGRKCLEEWLEKRHSKKSIKHGIQEEIYRTLEAHLPRLYPNESFSKKHLESHSEFLVYLIELKTSKDEITKALTFYRIFGSRAKEFKEIYDNWEYSNF